MLLVVYVYAVFTITSSFCFDRCCCCLIFFDRLHSGCALFGTEHHSFVVYKKKSSVLFEWHETVAVRFENAHHAHHSANGRCQYLQFTYSLHLMVSKEKKTITRLATYFCSSYMLQPNDFRC